MALVAEQDCAQQTPLCSGNNQILQVLQAAISMGYETPT